MTYKLALALKEAKFPQSIAPNAEYYIQEDLICQRKDIIKDLYDDKGEIVATNFFVYKPTLEELMRIVGTSDVDAGFEILANKFIETHGVNNKWPEDLDIPKP